MLNLYLNLYLYLYLNLYNTTAVGSRSFLEKISRCLLSVRVHLNPILKQLYLPLNLGRVLSRESRAQLFRPAGACSN
jgi:hypothetical protein